MDSLALALKKAGVINEADVARAQSEKRKEAEDLERRMRIYTRLLNAFPKRLGDTMCRWIESNRTLIPAEVLVHWKDTMAAGGVGTVWSEWSKWRKTWRKVQAERARYAGKRDE